MERGPLDLVSTNEELLGRKSSGSGPERSEYGRRDPYFACLVLPLLGDMFDFKKGILGSALKSSSCPLM
jgi:hypothetical protein